MSRNTPTKETVAHIGTRFLSRTEAIIVSVAAARAGVTQRSPSPRGDGERCVTPARAAAKETKAITATFPFSETVPCDSPNNTSRFMNALDHHKNAGLLFVFSKRPC